MDGERREPKVSRRKVCCWKRGGGKRSSRARRWTERKGDCERSGEGEDATPAREEPPRSRSWQVASSPVVVTALKPRSKASCRAIFGDRYGRLLSAGKTGLFIYLFIHLFIPSSLFGDFINRLVSWSFLLSFSSSFIKINRLAPSLSDLLRSSRGEKIEIVACRRGINKSNEQLIFFKNHLSI